jgi:hypothetical protein
MRNLMIECEGLKKVEQSIKNILKNGVDHLIDNNLNKVRKYEVNIMYGFVAIIIGYGIFSNLDKIKNIFS